MPSPGAAWEKARPMTTVTSPRTDKPVSLRDDLERRRLEHRAGRLRLVLHELRKRAAAASESGHVPPPLRCAIADFSAELAKVHRGLRRT
jgi:hypothetical protein